MSLNKMEIYGVVVVAVIVSLHKWNWYGCYWAVWRVQHVLNRATFNLLLRVCVCVQYIGIRSMRKTIANKMWVNVIISYLSNRSNYNFNNEYHSKAGTSTYITRGLLPLLIGKTIEMAISITRFIIKIYIYVPISLSLSLPPMRFAVAIHIFVILYGYI